MLNRKWLWKHKVPLLTSSVFFLLANTALWWEAWIGPWAMLTLLILAIWFFVIVVMYLLQLFSAWNEKFKDKSRLVLIGFMTVVLLSSIVFPRGLLGYDLFEGESLLIAYREGGGNCSSTLKLHANQRFTERSVCFGVTTIEGNYRLAGDTIFFEHVSSRSDKEFYAFAVLEHDPKTIGDLTLYRDHSDTTGSPMWISKNELGE